MPYLFGYPGHCGSVVIAFHSDNHRKNLNYLIKGKVYHSSFINTPHCLRLYEKILKYLEEGKLEYFFQTPVFKHYQTGREFFNIIYIPK